MKHNRRQFLGAIGATVIAQPVLSAEAKKAEANLGDRVLKHFHGGKGQSCAEAMLCAGLEYLGEPEELVRMATPFGGGMHMGDHCGFYCAGLVVIGLACAGRDDGKKLVNQLTGKYTEDWKKKRSLLCREIRKGQPSGDHKGCAKVGRDAGEVLDKLLCEIADSSKRARFARRS